MLRKNAQKEEMKIHENTRGSGNERGKEMKGERVKSTGELKLVLVWKEVQFKSTGMGGSF